MRKSKYGNVKTYGFDSKAEYARFVELKLLEQNGKIKDLICQQRFPLKVNGVLICTYFADFGYTERTKDGQRCVVEDVKGVRTGVYKLKKKLMKALYNVDIREIEAKDLRVRRKP